MKGCISEGCENIHMPDSVWCSFHSWLRECGPVVRHVITKCQEYTYHEEMDGMVGVHCGNKVIPGTTRCPDHTTNRCVERGCIEPRLPNRLRCYSHYVKLMPLCIVKGCWKHHRPHSPFCYTHKDHHVMYCKERVCDAAGDMDTCEATTEQGSDYCSRHTSYTVHKEDPSVVIISRVDGVSPDAPITTNAAGGQQSHSLYRCDLYPPLAFLHVSKILAYGATRYAPNNWKKIPVQDHLNHALVHIMAHQAGDTSDDHMGHAACRMQMALELHMEREGHK